MWHSSSGRLVYDPPRPGMKHNTAWWAIVAVDREITRYYRWWVARRFGIHLLPPTWDAHISVVRGEAPEPHLRPLWRRHHGETVTFRYRHYVQPGGRLSFPSHWPDFARWAATRPAVIARLGDVIGRRLRGADEIAALDIETYDHLLPAMRTKFEASMNGGREADVWVLEVDCPRLTEIRTELGRPTRYAHHLTIGRKPDLAERVSSCT